MAEEAQTTPIRQRTGLPAVTPEGSNIDRTPGAPLKEQIDRDTHLGTHEPTLPESPNEGSIQATPEENPEEAAAAYMMFSPRTATELPTLRTEEWDYKGLKPNPISISKARKLLSAAYAAVPCELTEAGVHGYAWIIETKELSKTMTRTPLQILGFDSFSLWTTIRQREAMYHPY